MAEQQQSALSQRRASLRSALQRSAHFLPIQAPLEVFVHNNLLVAFQDLPFHEGIAKAEKMIGIRGYYPEERYRQELANGRITEADLESVLADEQFSREPLAPGFLHEASLIKQLIAVEHTLFVP